MKNQMTMQNIQKITKWNHTWNIVKNNDQRKVHGFKLFNNREEIIGINELSSVLKKLEKI